MHRTRLEAPAPQSGRLRRRNRATAACDTLDPQMAHRKPVRGWLHQWAALIADLVRRPWAHVSHRMRFKVIAGPGFLGFRGGAFNPGAVVKNDGDILLLAKGQVQHWRYARPADYMRGAPVVVSLDERLRVRSTATIPKLDQLPSDNDTEVEDFRMFTFGGEIWVNHYLIEVLRTEQTRGYRGSRVCLSRFNAATNELTFLGHPRIDFEAQPREKNWVFMESNGELYLLYTFRPYRVLKLVDRQTLTFSTVVNRVYDIDVESLGGFSKPVSYSTNPIPYDGDHLLVLVHQSVRTPAGRCYYHWGVLLDKHDLAPQRVTSRPLVTGTGARGPLRGVLYVSSVIKLRNDFVLFNGEGDSYLTRTTVSKAKIERLWRTAPQMRQHAAVQFGASSETAAVVDARREDASVS
jgi:hypothetical protein